MPTSSFSAAPLPARANIRFWLLFCSCAFLLYSVAGAIRPPNSWSATQIAWSYHTGFIKRGLWGEGLRFFFDTITYQVVLVSSFLILSCELILLLAWCYRLARKFKGALLLSLFYLSPALSFLIHIVGYLDHVLLMITIAIALVPLDSRRGTVLIAALCVTGALIHELFCVIAVPVLVARMVLAAAQSGSVMPRQPVIAFASLLCINAALALMLCQSHVSASSAQGAAFIADIKQHTDFRLNRGNLDVLTRDLSANKERNILGKHPQENITILALFAKYGLVYAPIWGLYNLLTLLVLLHSCRNHATPRRAVIAAGLILSTLLPVFSILIAWDYSRLFCLSSVVSYIVFLTVVHHTPAELIPDLNRPLIWLLAGAVMVWDMLNHPLLMDGATVSPFPFTEKWTYLHDVMHGHAQLPAVPPPDY